MGLLWRQGVNAAGGELICGGCCSSAPPRETNARTATSGRPSLGPPHCVTGRGGNGGAQRRVALNRISVGGSLHVSGQAALPAGARLSKAPSSYPAGALLARLTLCGRANPRATLSRRWYATPWSREDLHVRRRVCRHAIEL